MAPSRSRRRAEATALRRQPLRADRERGPGQSVRGLGDFSAGQVHVARARNESAEVADDRLGQNEVILRPGSTFRIVLGKGVLVGLCIEHGRFARRRRKRPCLAWQTGF